MKTKEWYKRKSRDIYVKKANELGYVSRSAFKIIEIEKKFKLIKKSNSIIELGSAPGGWTQVILDIKKNNKIIFICIDKNPLEIFFDKKIHFIQEDFHNLENIKTKIKNFYTKKFELILSDMAPNTTGHSNTDHLKIVEIINRIIEFNKIFLNFNGNLILKIFKGSNEKNLISNLQKQFKSIKYFKPDSSRKNSSEIYLVCEKYNYK